MNDFFRHFDAASSQSYHGDHSHFGFNFDSLFDDEGEGYETDPFSGGNLFEFGDLFSSFGSFGESSNIHVHTSGSSQQNCRTVTKKQGNTVSTITECY
jgi:hypothetical protein